MRRAYTYPVNSLLATEWDADLQKIPYDDQSSWWTEKSTVARIWRKYLSDWVIYIVQMYSDTAEDKSK